MVAVLVLALLALALLLGSWRMAKAVALRRHAKTALRSAYRQLEQRVKERTRELRESEERYRAVVEDTRLLICRFLPGGEITYANESYCKYFEKTPDEVVGSSFLSQIPEADREIVMANISALTVESPTRSDERQVIAPHGGIRWQRWTDRALFDEQARPVEYQSIGEDIADRKQIEEALRLTNEHLNTVMRNAPIVLFALDREGVVTLCAGKGMELAGLDPDRVIGHSVPDLFHGIPGGDKIRADLQQGLSGREFTRVVEFAGRISETRYMPIRDESGETSGLIGVVTDITERMRAEEEKLALERQVLHAQKLESLGVLTGGIAHDFNNLLTVILGNTRVAAEDLQADVALRKRLERIQKAAETAARLTNQMLTYAGKNSVALRPENLSHLVAEIRDLLEAASGSQGTLELRLSEDLPGIEVDATQMSQVVLNLVTNAFEALEDQRGSVRVTTRRFEVDAAYLADCSGTQEPQPGPYVCLEVSDTGSGIDPADQVRLFEPFFTTRLSGHGLGLSSVLGIVRAHRGVIKVVSTPGEGTTFEVLLPPASGAVAPMAPNPAKKKGGSHRILVVDDEEDVLEISAEFLLRAGFEVIAAEGGRKAIEIFRSRCDEIDAVVLDFAMPELNGEQVLAELRRLRGDVPVVLVSGYSEEMAADRFARQALAGFLRKPYETDELVEKLNAAIAR